MSKITCTYTAEQFYGADGWEATEVTERWAGFATDRRAVYLVESDPAGTGTFIVTLLRQRDARSGDMVEYQTELTGDEAESIIEVAARIEVLDEEAS